MKKQLIQLLFIFYFSLFTSCASCTSHRTEKQPATSGTPPAKIEWTTKIHDFGEIAEGEIVTHTFFFKNIGQQNFVIKKIESSCGCTTADYKKAPLKAGENGKIEIAFNSSGRYGKQYKEISIFANVPEKKITLTIIANVK